MPRTRGRAYCSKNSALFFAPRHPNTKEAAGFVAGCFVKQAPNLSSSSHDMICQGWPRARARTCVPVAKLGPLWSSRYGLVSSYVQLAGPSPSHHCPVNLLLAGERTGTIWRCVAVPPGIGRPGEGGAPLRAASSSAARTIARYVKHGAHLSLTERDWRDVPQRLA